MHEAVKTLIFAAVAVLVALIAAFTYPKQEDYVPPDLVGKALFAEFDDPSEAAELQIVKFAEDVGQLTEFEVARDSSTGLWSIPSSSNYPADAETQMKDAATSLIDLRVLGIASSDTKDHQVYGVIEPDKQKLDASQAGVGLLITVKNAKGKDMARLIIGKRVKGTDDQHFVRKPGQNQVYVVKIQPSNFPTEFEKWIERDLLKVNTLDVERITFKDYSISTVQTLAGPRGRLEERYEAAVRWDSDQSKWVLDDFIQVRNGERRPTELLATEELNKQKLNDLKTALGDMKIVGVIRKPDGLGADLKAGEAFTDNDESLRSLMNRGFFAVPTENGPPEIRSANGEVLIGLKNGVEYVLRFGEVASVEQDTEEGELNRYLFVNARLDQAAIPQPEFEPEPSGDEAAETAADPAVAEGDEAAKTEGATEEKTDLELERERIRKENQRKQDEYDEALKKANQQIEELNARFADWYYIISEGEYKKVRLGRSDLITETETAVEEGFGVDALRQLEQEGIETQEQDSAPPAGSFRPPLGSPR